MARTFGVTTTSSATGGIVANSITTTTSVQTAEARNEMGKVTDLQAYSKATQISLNGVLDGTVSQAGTSITIGSTSYLITNASKTENNTGFQEGSITARKVDGATITEYSSSNS